MFTKETQKIIDIINEMVRKDEGVLNNEMAIEASRRLNKDISKKRVSQLRNQIGLGMLHLMSNKIIRKSDEHIQQGI